MPKKKSKKNTRSRSLESKKRRSRSGSRSRSRSNSYARKPRKTRSKTPKKNRERYFKTDNERTEKKINNSSGSPDTLKNRKRRKKSRSRSWTKERNEIPREEVGKKYRISPAFKAHKSRSRSPSRSYRRDFSYNHKTMRHKRYTRSRSYSSRSRTRSRSASHSKAKNFKSYCPTDPKYSKWDGQNQENFPIPTINSNLTQIPIDNQMGQYQNNQYRMPYSRYNKNSYLQSNYQFQFVQRQYLLNRQKSFQHLNQFGQFYSYMNQSQLQAINYSSPNEILHTEENREDTAKEDIEEELSIESSNESEISSQCDINESDLKLIKCESNLFDKLFPVNFSTVNSLINEKNLNENLKKINGSENKDILFKYLFTQSLEKDLKKFDLVYDCNYFNSDEH